MKCCEGLCAEKVVAVYRMAVCVGTIGCCAEHVRVFNGWLGTVEWLTESP